jgi:hypothetical protein
MILVISKIASDPFRLMIFIVAYSFLMTLYIIARLTGSTPLQVRKFAGILYTIYCVLSRAKAQNFVKKSIHAIGVNALFYRYRPLYQRA